MSSEGRTVVLSNRLPSREETDRIKPSCQRPHYLGLTQTLDSILRHGGGTWIGCSHTAEEDAASRMARNWNKTSEYSIAPVLLGTNERTDHQRFSNTVLWPLLQGLTSLSRNAADCWSGYCRVNGRFAEATRDIAGENDFVWVHDYPLMMVASLLRANGWRHRIGYFHHVPFPPPAAFQALPWRVELLHGLLQFDLIGFQRDEDRHNFAACLQEFLPLSRPLEIDGRLAIRTLDRETRVATYPVGIDFQTLSREASRTTILAAAKGVVKCVRGAQVILGVGPLEPTTGICESLNAFHHLLERNPEMEGRLTMIQIAVPSNERNLDRRTLEFQIETTVERINLRFGTPDWKPVQYFHRRLTEAQMIAFYRSANVALIAPWRDGISLAAKQFCACRTDMQGVLVLSEFTGVADELREGALFVNPFDPDDVARGLQRALWMSVSEQEERMVTLRTRIRANSVFNWSQTFLADADLLSPSPKIRQTAPEAVRAQVRG